jgi:hypothetical protein
MEIEEIIEVLGFANGNNRAVRLTMEDGTEVFGVPSSVDLHPTAYEVYLKPFGDDITEIGVSIGAISTAEMV